MVKSPLNHHGGRICLLLFSKHQTNKSKKNNRNMLCFVIAHKDHGPKILDKSPGKVLDMAFNKNFGRQVSWSFGAVRLHVERSFFLIFVHRFKIFRRCWCV